MLLSSGFAATLHKQARKNPRMTPEKNHARNHIGNSFLPSIANNSFSSAREFYRFYGKV